LLHRPVAFLRRHPIICLLLLTPGIPEYLSSSSPLSDIVLNPPQFAFQLVANLGLYGPGVLLIREAMVRWRKGWATVLLLGAAYGILEEGVALSTLFNPRAGPVVSSNLGTYGHWLGVNWVWSAAIIPVHMIYSISLPILLLGLAIPATRGRSLLSKRGVAAAFAILSLDVALLFLLILFGESYWAGGPIVASSFAAMAFLVYLARRAPSGKGLATAERPAATPRRMAVIGTCFYPTVLVVESVGMGLKVPALADLLLVVLVQGLFLVLVLRTAGSSHNEPQLIALSFGLILPIAAIGLIGTIGFPLALVGDLAMALFFGMLWRRYRSDTPDLPVQLVPDPGKGLS
jgi:hypothetical protein